MGILPMNKTSSPMKKPVIVSKYCKYHICSNSES